MTISALSVDPEDLFDDVRRGGPFGQGNDDDPSPPGPDCIAAHDRLFLPVAPLDENIRPEVLDESERRRFVK